MVDDCAYEEIRKHSVKMVSFLMEFVCKLFNSFYLVVGEEPMGKNVVDDVWWG